MKKILKKFPGDQEENNKRKKARKGNSSCDEGKGVYYSITSGIDSRERQSRKEKRAQEKRAITFKVINNGEGST